MCSFAAPGLGRPAIRGRRRRGHRSCYATVGDHAAKVGAGGRFRQFPGKRSGATAPIRACVAGRIAGPGETRRMVDQARSTRFHRRALPPMSVPRTSPGLRPERPEANVPHGNGSVNIEDRKCVITDRYFDASENSLAGEVPPCEQERRIPMTCARTRAGTGKPPLRLRSLSGRSLSRRRVLLAFAGGRVG